MCVCVCARVSVRACVIVRVHACACSRKRRPTYLPTYLVRELGVGEHCGQHDPRSDAPDGRRGNDTHAVGSTAPIQRFSHTNSMQPTYLSPYLSIHVPIYPSI